MTPNYGLAPRKKGCWICNHVGKVEDVTVRLLDDEGKPLPFGDAVEYITSIGLTLTNRGTPMSRNLMNSYLKKHRTHVLASMAVPESVVAPSRLVPLTPGDGLPTWVRAPDQAIDLGMNALSHLQGRLPEMEDRDLVSVARLGITAAGKRGDWQAKRIQMGQMDELLRIASGRKT